MSTSTAAARARAPLSELSRIVRALLLAIPLGLTYFQAVLLRGVEPPLVVASALFLLAAGLVTARWRWAPLLGALLGALVIAGRIANIVSDLSHPEALHLFSYMVVIVAMGLTLIVAGLAATVADLRHRGPSAPRGTRGALIVAAALVAGIILSAAIPRRAGAAVSAEALAQLPAIGAPAMRFDRGELRASVGQTFAMRFENTHSVGHSFDIDELNVHVSAAPGSSGLILFTPTEPGTYSFYCALPGHREAGMVGTLVVTE